MAAPRPPHNPLVVVLGATGTGKSKLATDLSTRFDGEVINGDAMQLYAGLPVITNKMPIEERMGVPHHLLGCVGLEENPWTVGDFVRVAGGVIEDIHSRGKLPILVGGTHYYLQSLLFRNSTLTNASLLPDATHSHTKTNATATINSTAGPAQSQLPASSSSSSPTPLTPDSSQRWPILSAPTPIILSELQKVDPVIAARWHPRDRRKIRRSLEIYLQTGRRASEVYAEQRRVAGGGGDGGKIGACGRRDVEGGSLALESATTSTSASASASASASTSASVEKSTEATLEEEEEGGRQNAESHNTTTRPPSTPLRYDPLLLWTHTPRPILTRRLDARVHAMLSHGLLDEVRQLEVERQRASSHERMMQAPDFYEKGIYAAIGYKEFREYVALIDESSSYLTQATSKSESGSARESSDPTSADNANNASLDSLPIPPAPPPPPPPAPHDEVSEYEAYQNRNKEQQQQQPQESGKAQQHQQQIQTKIEQESESHKQRILYSQSLERTQAATRQYARSQIKWIKNKLLPAFVEAGEGARVFLVDTGGVASEGERGKEEQRIEGQGGGERRSGQGEGGTTQREGEAKAQENRKEVETIDDAWTRNVVDPASSLVSRFLSLSSFSSSSSSGTTTTSNTLSTRSSPSLLSTNEAMPTPLAFYNSLHPPSSPNTQRHPHTHTHSPDPAIQTLLSHLCPLHPSSSPSPSFTPSPSSSTHPTPTPAHHQSPKSNLEPNRKKYTQTHCPLCDVTTLTEGEWATHLGSRRHKGVLRGRRRREENLRRLRERDALGGDSG